MIDLGMVLSYILAWLGIVCPSGLVFSLILTDSWLEWWVALAVVVVVV